MSLRVWNGSSWIYASPKVWNGGAWTSVKNAYVWNGSSWVSFYPNLKYNGTITAAYDTDGFTYEQYVFLSGAFGSASPTTLTDGKTFFELLTYYSPLGAFQYNYLDISGFSSDPGASYLSSIYISGTTYTLSSTDYVYGSGHATWTVATTPWLTGGGAYSVKLYGT